MRTLRGMTDELIRTTISSRSPLEPLRGYSRAVQLGDQLWISGTTAMNGKGEVTAPGDPYEQTRAVLATIRDILLSRGFHLSDVVRTRLFVTNISRWDDYARAHREVFEHVRPTSSMVQVVKLVDPRLVIELEVDAVRGATSTERATIEY